MSTRTILVVGRTGGGKSTICNIITNSDRFPEGDSSVSQTKESKALETQHQGISYTVIDTVGLGDTSGKTEKQLLEDMAAAFKGVTDSVSQILFVFNGKFTQTEIEAYKLLNIVFGKDVRSFTTIIRTFFPKYNDVARCQEDIDQIKAETNETRDIVSNCNKFLHFNNNCAIEQPSLQNRTNGTTKILVHLQGCNKSFATNEATMRANIQSHVASVEEKKRKEEEEKRKLIEREQNLAKELEAAKIEAARLQRLIQSGRVLCHSCSNPLIEVSGNNTTIHANLSFAQGGLCLQCTKCQVSKNFSQQEWAALPFKTGLTWSC